MKSVMRLRVFWCCLLVTGTFLFLISCGSGDDEESSPDGGEADDDDTICLDDNDTDDPFPDDDAADDDAADDDAVDDDDDNDDNNDDNNDNDDDSTPGMAVIAVEQGRGIILFAPDAGKPWPKQSPQTKDELTIEVLYGGAPGATGTSLATVPFTPPASVEFQVYLARYPKIKADRAGYLHLVYWDMAERNLMYADNVGGVWTTSTIAENLVPYNLDLTLDPSGYSHLCWIETPGFQLHYAANRSGVWETETIRIGTFSNCRIAAGRQGAVHILFISYDDGSKGMMVAAKASGDWEFTLIDRYVPMPVWTPFFSNPQIKLTDDDTPYACFTYEGANYFLPWAEFFTSFRCGTKIEGGWQVEEVLYDGAYDQYDMTMDLDRDNFPHLIFGNGNFTDYATNVGGAWERFDLLDMGGEASDLQLDEVDAFHFSHYDYGLQYSTDASGAWITKQLADPSAPNEDPVTALQLHPDGFSHAVFLRDAPRDLMYGHNRNGDWTWEQIGEPDSPWQWFSFVLDAEGHAYVGYESRELYLATNRTGDWAVELIDDAVPYDYSGPGLAVGADGTMYAAFGDLELEELVCAENRSGQWERRIVQSDVAAYAPAIVLDRENAVHLAYSIGGVTPSSLMIADNCSGNWQTEVVASDVEVNGAPSQALDADGNTHLFFYDRETLSFIYMNNRGGAWMEEAVGTGEDASLKYSMALDDQGFAHVAYDNGESDLIYATNMSGVWTATPIDTEGDVGMYPSLAVATDDLVHVLYTSTSELLYAAFPAGY